ncbi:hypothetical protein [Streptomyces sp. NBC_00500]|uniref:hypothetical protein n=1 Tax=unclassified Streptomyces TaxID=2593676 RepID=UPI003866F275
MMNVPATTRFWVPQTFEGGFPASGGVRDRVERAVRPPGRAAEVRRECEQEGDGREERPAGVGQR